MALFTGKKPLRSTNARIERRKIMPWKIMALVAAVLVPLAGSIILAHLSRFRIETVVLSGNIVVADNDLLEHVRHQIAGKYAWLFPRDNIALYPRSELAAGIAQSFKRFETVEVSTVNARTIAVKVTERKPEYLWCGAQAPQEATDEAAHCYFLDNIGYIFAEAPYFSGHVYHTFYGPIVASSTDLLGQQFMPEDRFTGMINALDMLATMGLEPQSLEVLASDAPDLPDYRLTLAGGGTLTFRSADSARIDSIMLSILSAEVFASTSPSKLGMKADYIDARYGDKVVYKLRDKSAPSSVASTTPTSR